MSDRPTPETDKLITDWIQGVTNELPNFVETARKLERERDEAMEEIKRLKAILDLIKKDVS